MLFHLDLSSSEMINRIESRTGKCLQKMQLVRVARAALLATACIRPTTVPACPSTGSSGSRRACEKEDPEE